MTTPHGPGSGQVVRSVRSRPASAATARAFSLVIQADRPPDEAARLLAHTSTAGALREALAHLQPTLFADDEDRVAAAATELLLRALATSAGHEPLPWPLSPVVRVAA